MNNLVKSTEAAPATLPASTPRTREEAPIARYRRGQKVSRPRYMSGTARRRRLNAFAETNSADLVAQTLTRVCAIPYPQRSFRAC